jgi:hypothetical protein
MGQLFQLDNFTMNILTLKFSYFRNHLLKRSKYFFISNDKITNSEYLYRFDNEATKKTVNELQGMIDGTLAWTETEWAADDLFHVVSGKELSRIENHELWDDVNDCWKVLAHYPTKDLLDLLKVWQAFQEKYSIPENYKAIAKEAFEIIRVEPMKYDKHKNGTNSHFEVEIDNIHVVIQVEDINEFELSPEEYITQIK